MSKAKMGQFVQVHYTGRLTDGSVFDSSEGRAPLEFQVGRNMVIPGFEDAVRDMEINDERQVNLTKEEAYGDRREDLVRDFPAEMLNGEKVQVGQSLWFNSPQGHVSGKVLVVETEKFTVDFNHPLAGQNLEFSLKLVGISDAPTQASGCGCGSAPSPECGSSCSC